MEQFEYYTYVHNLGGLSGGNIDELLLQERVNALGSKGWELVNSVASNGGHGYTRCLVFIFKRKL